jgi:hypothetical protein
VDVREHQKTEGGQLLHCSLERHARHARRGTRELHEQSRGRHLGAEYCLEAGGTFATDGGHFDNAAIGKTATMEMTPRLGK